MIINSSLTMIMATMMVIDDGEANNDGREVNNDNGEDDGPYQSCTSSVCVRDNECTVDSQCPGSQVDTNLLSVVCLFVCLFVCSFVRSFVRSFVCCLFVCLFVRLLARLFVRLLVSFVCCSHVLTRYRPSSL